MADPCLGCGTEIDPTTQQLTIKGANSAVWPTDYGDTTTSSGLHCDPNTGNLWTAPPFKFGTIGAPAPTSWPGATNSSSFLETYQYNVAQGIWGFHAVATSGVGTLTNTSSEPLVSKVRVGCNLGIYSGSTSNDIVCGVRATVRYYEVAGGALSNESIVDLRMHSYTGIMSNSSWYEREIGTWTVPEGARLTLQYQPFWSAILPVGNTGLLGASCHWSSPFGNITYWTGRPV